MATIVTVAMAVPVLRAPSERLFGSDIVGRHHDPFTVMERFEQPLNIGVYSQPVTDIPGALLARLAGPVAAYNWLVLLSFPLAAVAAYMLARHLTLSPTGAAIAAMAYAFSPFHVAHAAYHPHVAQTQWIPLYLLALWRCLDHASLAALLWLGVATMAVTLSNFYGGFIAAVITPVAVAAYWLSARRAGTGSVRGLGVTAGGLLMIAASGIGYAACAASDVVVNLAAVAFPRADLFRYSATWWGYLVPPVAHPLLGVTAHRVWNAVGTGEALLERQVSLGWGLVALGIVAVSRWLLGNRQPASLARVPALVLVAIAAIVCSLSPERIVGTFTFTRPSAVLYDILPMFRSYARFGVVVQLMAALLAGVGVDALQRAGTIPARVVCVALVALGAFEYVALPSRLWRDVLPTTAHRWVMRQPAPVRVFDCMRRDQESRSVSQLTDQRVTFGSPTSDCTEPHLPQTLAATGYTHLLVRRGTADGQWFAAHAARDGLRLVASLDDGQVFAVTAPAPAIHIAAMAGFSPREHNTEWTWRWMANAAAWTIVNPRSQPIDTILDLELSAFHRGRHLEVQLDGRHVQTVFVEPARRIYTIGPLTVPPGGHGLVFRAAEAATVASEVIDNGDLRPLSFAVGTWDWKMRGDQP